MAQALHNKRRILYAKVETTPGTYVGDGTLFVAANAQLLQAKNIKFMPNVSNYARDPDGISLQPIAGVKGQGSGKVTFESVAFTSGAAGTAPAYSALLRACFLKETISAGVSVTYAKDPNSTVTLSMGVGILQEDGSVEVQWAMAGVRGNVIHKAGKIGEPIVFDWSFDGKLAVSAGVVLPSTDQAAMTTLTFADEVANVVKFWQFSGTPTGIFARQINNMTLDMGTGVELTTDTVDPSGYGYAILAKDSPTLKLDPSKVPRTIKNDVADHLSGTLFSSTVTLGSVAGKKLSYNLPNCQITGLGDATRGNVSTWDCSIDLVRTATGTTSDAVSFVFA